jgi:hypothetical protein
MADSYGGGGMPGMCAHGRTGACKQCRNQASIPAAAPVPPHSGGQEASPGDPTPKPKPGGNQGAQAKLAPMAELIRLLREAQQAKYDEFCARGHRPIMAYLMVRRMGGYV